MQKNLPYVLGAIVLVALGGLGWWYTSQSEIQPYPLELMAGDSVSSWEFSGAYTSSPELKERAEKEMLRLKGLFGTGEASDYELYVSIANQYYLLGDGANNFLYLKKALAVDATTTGLAWYNMGVLLEQLGAFNTARHAFEQAAKVQAIPQYQAALASFLKAHPAGAK